MVTININKHKKNDTAVVVGGSLSGLMAAIALSHQGIRVKVLEKSKEEARSGAGLKIDGYSPNQTKIEEKLKRLASNGKSTVQLWSSIESRLRNDAIKDPNITLHYNTRVISVDQNEESAWAETEDGQLFEGNILIGADGHRSIVRKKVAPNHPDAEFAGYVVWMASIMENQLPKDKIPDLKGEQVKIFNSSGGFIFGSVIEVENEERRIGCTWYDNTHTDLLYRLGAVQGKFVHHSIQGSDIPEKDLDIIANQAEVNWPEPWRTASLLAIHSRDFIGVPIKEYVPTKLVNGRLAIVGDAAHVPSPITAGGFNESLKDAVALSECVSGNLLGSNAISALEKYESMRLEKMQEMVESGRQFSKEFGRY